MISNLFKNKIRDLKIVYDTYRIGQESLLAMMDEDEIPEIVYHSNALERSSLTLPETEKILADRELSRNAPPREVQEAKNLTRVIAYARATSLNQDLSSDFILQLHQMLMGTVDDRIAGRYHQDPASETVENRIQELVINDSSDFTTYFVEKIAKFHLEFNAIQPFTDGNGPISRVIIQFQLQRLGFPYVTIRSKGKEKYYKAIEEYNLAKETKPMENILLYGLLESLHKRITYLKEERIITLSDYAKNHNKTALAMFNAAKRQSVPAFRERGIWKIGEEE